MHGLGNNYIYIDRFACNINDDWLPYLARTVSDVHTGIGSDGLILIQPSKHADVGMRIFNKDGSEGKNCGNGLRCVAKYAYENGIVSETSFRIETKTNIVDADVYTDAGMVPYVTINMGMPILRRSDIPMDGDDRSSVVAEPVVIDDQSLSLTAVSMGNPHAVFFVEDIRSAPVETLGPRIETHQLFPEDVNAEFIEMISRNELNFRVWERGSGMTQACGTGACAAVVAAVLNERAERGEDVTVHLDGGDLYIQWQDHGDVLMTGGAETIASGDYHFHIT
ncbi:diaminopimelate epimerase [Lentibacillus halophilus]